MNLYAATGRIFLGICLTGIGVLHFFFPGIRPIILPNSTAITPSLYWIVYATGIVLTGSGIFIIINKKTATISLIMAAVFFILFFVGHLPAFLSVQGLEKLKYWTNLNKVLALSGGFLILSFIYVREDGNTKPIAFFKVISVIGRCFFALMLLLFGIGHLTSTASLSTLVPPYIPFARFWTFAGGIILVGSAISFFINFKVRISAFILAGTLFTWLITLHLYYALLFPAWQEGENFIGSLTCMAFCGIALLIAQNSSAYKSIPQHT